jgi:nicotinamide-nucleotide amidase
MVTKIAASIITIGDELLIGQTIDTNSAWLAQQLNAIGVWVQHRIAVGDNAKDINDALDNAIAHNNIVIITGGLGPTSDDITKPLLCKYFGASLIQNEKVAAHVRAFFEKRNRPILDVNIAQANVPDNCTVLWNQYGTAPGMLFTKNDTIIISLPGVPLEMMDIMTTSGIAIIKSKFILPKVIHRTVATSGKGESFVAMMLRDFEKQLPQGLQIAYLPALGQLKIRLTGIEIADDIIEIQFEKLCKQLGHLVYASTDIKLEEAIAQILIQKNKTIAIAESCTGGNIANAFTNISGASIFFNGALVTYANDAKINLLDVQAADIDVYTSVSEEVTKAMALNAILKFKSNYALAITGYLEKPDANTDAYIWIAVTNGRDVKTIKHLIAYNRVKNKDLASNLALDFLRHFIIEN